MPAETNGNGFSQRVRAVVPEVAEETLEELFADAGPDPLTFTSEGKKITQNLIVGEFNPEKFLSLTKPLQVFAAAAIFVLKGYDEFRQVLPTFPLDLRLGNRLILMNNARLVVFYLEEFPENLRGALLRAVIHSYGLSDTSHREVYEQLYLVPDGQKLDIFRFLSLEVCTPLAIHRTFPQGSPERARAIEFLEECVAGDELCGEQTMENRENFSAEEFARLEKVYKEAWK